eukprot:Platyproteum_vivax@DN11990_c0_g1_i1.p1
MVLPIHKKENHPCLMNGLSTETEGFVSAVGHVDDWSRSNVTTDDTENHEEVEFASALTSQPTSDGDEFLSGLGDPQVHKDSPCHVMGTGLIHSEFQRADITRLSSVPNPLALGIDRANPRLYMVPYPGCNLQQLSAIRKVQRTTTMPVARAPPPTISVLRRSQKPPEGQEAFLIPGPGGAADVVVEGDEELEVHPTNGLRNGSLCSTQAWWKRLLCWNAVPLRRDIHVEVCSEVDEDDLCPMMKESSEEILTDRH